MDICTKAASSNSQIYAKHSHAIQSDIPSNIFDLLKLIIIFLIIWEYPPPPGLVPPLVN